MNYEGDDGYKQIAPYTPSAFCFWCALMCGPSDDQKIRGAALLR